MSSILFNAYLTIMILYALASLFWSVNRFHERKFPKPNVRVLVMLPCKGVDLTFRDNLKALKNQSYRYHKLIAIVDNASDPAVQYLKSEKIEFITTDKRFREGSGKVNALCTAIAKYPDYSTYVIIDSDVAAHKDWLGKLIAPLQDEKIGISTTFPYFEPNDKAFWSNVKCVWGFVGKGMMESQSLRFGWGGSLAFKRELFDEKSFERFTHEVSDDIFITSLCRKKGLDIAYVPSAEVRVNCRETFGTFFEWANRQTAFSILGNKKVFWIGAVSYSMGILLLLTGVYISIAQSFVYLLLLAPFVVGTIKNYSRLEQPMWEFFFINAAMPFIFLVNLVAAKRKSSVTWRGKVYQIKS